MYECLNSLRWAVHVTHVAPAAVLRHRFTRSLECTEQDACPAALVPAAIVLPPAGRQDRCVRAGNGLRGQRPAAGARFYMYEGARPASYVVQWAVQEVVQMHSQVVAHMDQTLRVCCPPECRSARLLGTRLGLPELQTSSPCP